MKSYDEIENIFSDRKAIVLGNGPSLDNLNFDLIKENRDIVTFSTNQIADVCKRNSWFPDFYASFFCGPMRGKSYSFSDGTSISYPGSYEKALEARDDISYVVGNSKTTCFVHEWYREFLQESKNLNFIKPRLWNRHQPFPENGFELFKLPDNFLWHSATTPLFQLCFFLGFKKIAVIGQDGYREGRDNHFSKYRGNELETESHIKRANSSISLLHNAVKFYASKSDIDTFNLSNISILDQHEIITLEDFISL